MKNWEKKKNEWIEMRKKRKDRKKIIPCKDHHIQKHESSKEKEKLPLMIKYTIQSWNDYHINDISNCISQHPNGHHYSLHGFWSLGETKLQCGNTEENFSSCDHHLKMVIILIQIHFNIKYCVHFTKNRNIIY